jgi:hypothetical protein
LANKSVEIIRLLFRPVVHNRPVFYFNYLISPHIMDGTYFA